MAVGAVRGMMVSTEDLEVGTTVTVDHEIYTIADLYGKGADHVVVLAPGYGESWHLEVADQDYSEPMWEKV